MPEMLGVLEAAWPEMERKDYSERAYKVSQGECTLAEFGAWIRDTVYYLEGRGSKGLPSKEKREQQVEAHTELCSAFHYLQGVPGAHQHRLIETVKFNLGLLLEAVGQFRRLNFSSRSYHVHYLRAHADAVQQACNAK